MRVAVSTHRWKRRMEAAEQERAEQMFDANEPAVGTARGRYCHSTETRFRKEPTPDDTATGTQKVPQ